MWRPFNYIWFYCCQNSTGIVINTGTTDWCSSEGMNGPSSKEITNNKEYDKYSYSR